MRATTIRFSDPIYQRLELASGYTGLPINAIVTAACMEWLRQQFPSPVGTALTSDASAAPAEPDTLERLLPGRRRDQGPPLGSDARDAFRRAEREARRARHEAVGTEHLLLAIAAEEAGPGAQALEQVGIDANAVRNALDFMVGRGQHPAGADLRLSAHAAQAVRRAVEEARRRQASEVDTAYLLLAICNDEECLALRVVESVGSGADELRAAIESQLA